MFLQLLLLFQKKQHVVAVVVELDCFAVLESPISRHDPCLQLQLRMTLIGGRGDFEWLKTVFLLKHLLLFFAVHYSFWGKNRHSEGFCGQLFEQYNLLANSCHYISGQGASLHCGLLFSVRHSMMGIGFFRFLVRL